MMAVTACDQADRPPYPADDLPAAALSEVREFCLQGELDLGARYQGRSPGPGDRYPARWCVISEDAKGRVWFSAEGNTNPDVDGSWSVSYLPPDRVRINNVNEPPDVEFTGVHLEEEAQAVRRLDPMRLMAELEMKSGSIEGLEVVHARGRMAEVRTHVDMPLRGRTDVRWLWNWEESGRPTVTLQLDGQSVFEARGQWRAVSEDEAEVLWTRSGGEAAIQVPPEFWPSRVHLELETLTHGVHLVKGVRTGFQHMVVETDAGLVVADAPSGWVELHLIPPQDLVPGLGVSGLSQKLVDFLREKFPDTPIAAVVITHAHDDHAGGARAFAAAGASVYAPVEDVAFLKQAYASPKMPADVLTTRKQIIDPIGVSIREGAEIGRVGQRVWVRHLGSGPHADAVLGVWAVDSGYFFVSDVHGPGSDAGHPAPSRADTECWFAQWAVNNLPDDVIVLNSHTSPRTPVSRLAQYLDSEACQDLAG